MGASPCGPAPRSRPPTPSTAAGAAVPPPRQCRPASPRLGGPSTTPAGSPANAPTWQIAATPFAADYAGLRYGPGPGDPDRQNASTTTEFHPDEHRPTRPRLASSAAGLLSLFATAGHAERYADRLEAQQFIDRDDRQARLRQGTPSPTSSGAPIPAVGDQVHLAPKDPGVRSWQRYRGPLHRARPHQGRPGLLEASRATIRAASEKYGVPGIIVGIIGVETIYGRNTGNFTRPCPRLHPRLRLPPPRRALPRRTEPCC